MSDWEAARTFAWPRVQQVGPLRFDLGKRPIEARVARVAKGAKFERKRKYMRLQREVDWNERKARRGKARKQARSRP